MAAEQEHKPQQATDRETMKNDAGQMIRERVGTGTEGIDHKRYRL